MGKTNDQDTNHRVPRETSFKKAVYEATLFGLRKKYWVHVTAARYLFKDDIVAFALLHLHKTRFAHLYPWTRQAKDFYRKILKNDEAIKKLTQYDISEQELKTTLKQLKELEGNKFWKKQTHEDWARSEYKFQQAYKEARETFTKVAEVSHTAFKDQPETLVELGLGKSIEEVLEKQEKDQRRRWKNREREKQVEEILKKNK